MGAHRTCFASWRRWGSRHPGIACEPFDGHASGKRCLGIAKEESPRHVYQAGMHVLAEAIAAWCSCPKWQSGNPPEAGATVCCKGPRKIGAGVHMGTSHMSCILAQTGQPTSRNRARANHLM